MEVKVEPLKGFSPQIGLLVSQMDYARKTTRQAVEGLTMDQLDFLPGHDGNTIGALLLHIAAVEKGFQIEIFDGRAPNEQEMQEWGLLTVLEKKEEKTFRGTPLNTIFLNLKK
ncbi:DinB family protein [Halobacillus sp. HZG1]|uniref:DinB family protein n=1 Tax=Halobacillus sp. HZG1 TaxID=3111769 RepID=UPI003FA38B0F